MMVFDELTQHADARAMVDHLLAQALHRSASDIHIDPQADGVHFRLRIDGLLHDPEVIPAEAGRAVVTRLMVMAQLLTYRLDVPQEGRLTFAPKSNESPSKGNSSQHGPSRLSSLVGGNYSGVTVVDMRVSVMPTTHGLRAVIRLPAELAQPRRLNELGLSEPPLNALLQFAQMDTGLLLLTGPAGSGKTTTIYALLQHIFDTQDGVSIISLEDPVERDLPGVSQVQVSSQGQLTYDRALAGIMRQDPQVLALGEIRDRNTASIAIQAALSGHRLIATLHAGSSVAALARLIEMNIEPYQITSALFGVINQRLVRRSFESDTSDDYRGRAVIANFTDVNEALRSAIIEHPDSDSLHAAVIAQPHYHSLRTVADDLVTKGVTRRQEVERVLGPVDP